MDAVDASKHTEIYTTEQVPSLCTIIIDTNPQAWAALAKTLPVSRAIANILVYINSQLAFSNSNQVAIIASHSNRAIWLYPSPASTARRKAKDNDGDVDMEDDDDDQGNSSKTATANKYPPFAKIESSILTSLRKLMTSTTPSDLSAENETQMSGALTLALSYINKASVVRSQGNSSKSANQQSGRGLKSSTTPLDTTTGNGNGSNSSSGGTHPGGGNLPGLNARILVLSVSDSAAAQYIPTMNAVFAASHAGIPIDTLALAGSATFLQQASFITRGAFLEAKDHAQGLLTYLLFGMAASSSSSGGGPDGESQDQVGGGGGGGGAAGNDLNSAAGDAENRDTQSYTGQLLVNPAAANVDFRAVCFCHRDVVDMGYMCSICLSVFCEIPEAATCLTCGTVLKLGKYGNKPAVVPKRKKKRKLGPGAGGTPIVGGPPVVGGSASAVGTPA